MDYSASAFLICMTNILIFMSKSAEFMYVITVILRCDIALLWRINFPLKLLPAQVSWEVWILMPCFMTF